ncbi:putative cyclin-dependent serine/threonine-protein kinase DDB_G0272797/DDB_G0274007 [Calliphora vicina]|uniref:putative cyclin-dependent serine/threonine-protein kinase DDB_G0272797/DDB_G0274007 n=1 Tax=Calliphora vicina TaxID=7373 RepID=UPI00325BF654
MLALSHFYYLTIFVYIVFCLQTVQSDLQISPEDVEYATKRIANRHRAVHFKSQPYFRHVTESNINSFTSVAQRKSGIKQQQQPQHDVEDMPQMEAHSEDVLSGGKESSPTHNRWCMKNNSKKVDAAQSTTLSKQHEIKPIEGVQEEQAPQDRQQDAGAKPIIQNGVNQPHNHQNQQHLTVNQAKVKQQLSPHHFKLLNVVNHRNKRQTPAVNNNNSNNNGNQQQHSTFTIQYYPYQQQPEQQQQQTAVQYQLQEQQPQQYQLQYYQPSQSQSQHQQNYNNIELIVNGNSLSTFSQSTAALAAATNIQQQELPMTLAISLPIATSTPKPKPLQGLPTLTTPSSLLPLTTVNPFKPLLPLEIINDFNDGPTTPPPPLVCQMCCVTNEFPCSQCCDGTPLLNAQTLKTLGG